MERVMIDLKAAMPADAITTTDAGSFGQWQQRYLEFDHPDSYISPTLGCMGPGVPSAVAAKLAHPNRTVIAHIGDGGFLMTGQEMATAKQYGAHIISIVYNNEVTTRFACKPNTWPPTWRRVDNPDFALMGESYGTLGLKVAAMKNFYWRLKSSETDRSALMSADRLQYVTPTPNSPSFAARNWPGTNEFV
jgi:acetolactate synthase-1/2/3 large subunit